MNMFYADSQNAIGNEGFRCSDPVNRKYFEKSFAVFDKLPCDIIVSAHPEASGLWEKLAKRDKGDTNGLVDAGACNAYAAGARARLEQRLQKEKK